MNKSHDAESCVHMHSWREASHRGEDIILQEKQLEPVFYFLLWQDAQSAGPERPSAPSWREVSLTLQSVLQDINKKQKPAKKQTDLSFKVSSLKTKKSLKCWSAGVANWKSSALLHRYN